jgi:hypothetical protein
MEPLRLMVGTLKEYWDCALATFAKLKTTPPPEEVKSKLKLSSLPQVCSIIVKLNVESAASVKIGTEIINDNKKITREQKYIFFIRLKSLILKPYMP